MCVKNYVGYFHIRIIAERYSLSNRAIVSEKLQKAADPSLNTSPNLPSLTWIIMTIIITMSLKVTSDKDTEVRKISKKVLKKLWR